MENQTCGCKLPDINIPETLPDFNSPGNIGSWRQVLAANIGKKVRMELVAVLDGPLRTVCGEIYAVGNSWVALAGCGKIVLADTLAIKFLYFE